MSTRSIRRGSNLEPGTPHPEPNPEPRTPHSEPNPEPRTPHSEPNPAPRTPNPEQHPAPGTLNPAPDRRSVLFIASEALPFSKSGGLADVAGALPPAIARLGWAVTVAVPRYRGVTAGELVEQFPIVIGGRAHDVGFYEAPLDGGARALLIDCPELYDRDALYGPNNTDYPDNARRFAMLSRAALEFVGRRARPTVVHAHDWQAGLAPVYLQTLYAAHPMLAGTPTVFTIHNLAYQGSFEPTWLPRLDLGWDEFTVDRLEFWGRISFLKGGINRATFITTVSPRYAQEIQTPDAGFGFDGIMRARRDRLVGILNGIDTREWDPRRDRFVPAPFSADDLSAKLASKREVLARFGLARDAAAERRPLIGMVSRMVDQKGLDLIAALASQLPRREAAFAVLGTGEPRYQEFWRALAAAHPDRIGVRVGFDEALAHLIEAGADMFLMPSRFEPCGLNQMYSLRYGTVPIVRAVGGLADTVFDADTAGDGAAHRPNGFVFHVYRPGALLEAIDRALSAFADKARWRSLQLNGMTADHSWDRSAAEYVKIYDRAAAEGAARVGAP
jgi:starch synthase